MNRMFVTPLLGISQEGPKAANATRSGCVHFRQGDLDGACGPYCMIMALIAMGLLTRNKALAMETWDGRKREGRFRDAIKKFGVLSTNGTYSHDLVWLTVFFKTKNIGARVITGNAVQLLESVVDAVGRNAIPVILITWEKGGGHWLLGVGYQEIQRRSKSIPTHFLCLDPSQETPKTSLWNAVLDISGPDGSPYNPRRFSIPANYWGMNDSTEKCAIKEVVVLEMN
ncbi:MAG: hypothetical protein FIA96_16190 [Betaproteobacteria bacterium]|nr:hypothetical protein [Betaproteobacteria bacterium]